MRLIAEILCDKARKFYDCTQKIKNAIPIRPWYIDPSRDFRPQAPL